MNEITRIRSISSIDDFLKYEITIETILIIGIMWSLFALSIIIYFGGIKNTIDFFKLKCYSILISNDTKPYGKMSDKKHDNLDKVD